MACGLTLATLLTIFFDTLILTALAATPNLSVLIDSATQSSLWLTVHITTVLELPVKQGCSILVNFESLKFM